ncbi:hypothetical protein [Alicyclobacillus sp. SO9]|uniref:hypothetical protein n=1 Tax=Alicyclobacillus sp. SO9 TaxID=2665646 RepID=UPI0018E71258|nr:hypothetical protein [Alicyclobacillus sp. SO9]QQE77548.1 hypothetical protein GI364_16595 [Alicyclobacillus sp. SO9]
MNSAKKRNLTLALLALVTLAGAGIYIFTGNKTQSLRNQQQALTSKLSSERVVLAQDEKNYKAQQNTATSSPMLHASSEPALFRSMTQLAGQANVSIQSMSISKAGKGTSQNASATLRVHGTTSELLSFVAVLQDSPGTLSITALDLQTAKGPTTMALQITLPVGRHS